MMDKRDRDRDGCIYAQLCAKYLANNQFIWGSTYVSVVGGGDLSATIGTPVAFTFTMHSFCKLHKFFIIITVDKLLLIRPILLFIIIQFFTFYV